MALARAGVGFLLVLGPLPGVGAGIPGIRGGHRSQAGVAAPLHRPPGRIPTELEASGRRQPRLWMGGDGSAEEVQAALERLQERHGDEVALRVQPALPTSPLEHQRYRLTPA